MSEIKQDWAEKPSYIILKHQPHERQQFVDQDVTAMLKLQWTLQVEEGTKQKQLRIAEWS